MDDSLRELEDELGRMGEEPTFDEQPPATASDAPTPVEKTVSTEDVSAERRSEPGSSEAAPIPVSPSPGSQTDLHSSSGSLGTSPGEGERVRRLPSFANRKKASGNADTVEKGGTFGRKMARSIIGGKLGKSSEEPKSNLEAHLASLLGEREGSDDEDLGSDNDEFRWERPPVVRPDWDILDCTEAESSDHVHPDPAVAALLNKEKCEMWGYRCEIGSKTHSRNGFGQVVGDSKRSVNEFDPDFEEVEEIDKDLPYYLTYFSKVKHVNFLCEDPDHGPLCLTFEVTGTGEYLHHDKECPEHLKVRKGGLPCKAILRGKSGITRLVIPTEFCSSNKEKLRFIRSTNPSWSRLKFVEIGDPDLVTKLEEFERQYMIGTYKFGVLLAQCDHTDENDMFSNQSHEASSHFEEFLTLLGEKVTLKGWSKFRGGLNIRDDSTGTHSIYTCLDERGRDFVEPPASDDDDTIEQPVKREIMFHVSTMLPYQVNDLQRVERKRHLGNDIVVVVFRDLPPEGSDREMASFDPNCVASHFNHVFVCVSVDPEATKATGTTHYRVAIALKGGAVPFSPFLPCSPVFAHGPEFRKFFLTKLLNAERSCIWHAPDFKLKMVRTAKALLTNMCETFIPKAKAKNRELQKEQKSRKNEDVQITGPSGFQVRGSGGTALPVFADGSASNPELSKSATALDGRQLKYANCSLEEVAEKLAAAQRNATALEKLVAMYSNDPAGAREAEANREDALAEVVALEAVQKSKQDMEAIVSSDSPVTVSVHRPIGPVPEAPDSEDEEESALQIMQKLVEESAPKPEPASSGRPSERKIYVQIPKDIVSTARAESKQRAEEQVVWLSTSRTTREDRFTLSDDNVEEFEEALRNYRKGEVSNVVCLAFRTSRTKFTVQHMFASRKSHSAFDWSAWEGVLSKATPAGKAAVETSILQEV